MKTTIKNSTLLYYISEGENEELKLKCFQEIVEKLLMGDLSVTIQDLANSKAISFLMSISTSEFKRLKKDLEVYFEDNEGNPRAIMIAISLSDMLGSDMVEKFVNLPFKIDIDPDWKMLVSFILHNPKALFMAEDYVLEYARLQKLPNLDLEVIKLYTEDQANRLTAVLYRTAFSSFNAIGLIDKMAELYKISELPSNKNYSSSLNAITGTLKSKAFDIQAMFERLKSEDYFDVEWRLKALRMISYILL